MLRLQIYEESSCTFGLLVNTILVNKHINKYIQKVTVINLNKQILNH